MMPTSEAKNAVQEQDNDASGRPKPSLWRPRALPSTFTTTIERMEPQPQSFRSKSIPMRMKRTSSELQLSRDEAEAEERDYAMFVKIYEHLQEQQEQIKDTRLLKENELWMDRLIENRMQHERQFQKDRGGRPSLSPSGVDDSLDGYGIEKDPQDFGEIFELEL